MCIRVSGRYPIAVIEKTFRFILYTSHTFIDLNYLRQIFANKQFLLPGFFIKTRFVNRIKSLRLILRLFVIQLIFKIFFYFLPRVNLFRYLNFRRFLWKRDALCIFFLFDFFHCHFFYLLIKYIHYQICKQYFKVIYFIQVF